MDTLPLLCVCRIGKRKFAVNTARLWEHLGLSNDDYLKICKSEKDHVEIKIEVYNNTGFTKEDI